MTPIEYDFLRKLLKERSGLVLSAEKHYLLESRLLPVARKHGLAGLSELVQKLRSPGAEPLTVDVVEAMTTNESFFFRDKLPFEHFQNLMIPHLVTARAVQKRIRIWCAAAASGQEPYSLAMILKEMGSKLAGFRIEIIATDLSNEILEKAKSGLYSQFEVQRGLPIRKLIAFFEKAGDLWRISDRLRAAVKFERHNLLHHPGQLGQFDIVILAHVLTCFDEPIRLAVLEHVAGAMAPGAVLLLGAGETLPEGFTQLTLENGVARKPGAAQVAAA